MTRIFSLIAAVAIAAPAVATAAPVERRLHTDSTESSSFLWNDWNKFQENYHPNYIADDDAKTAWVEGAATSGAGEWVRINLTELDKTTKLRLKIRNGYQKSKGLFKANARAKDITVRLLPSKTEVKATLADKDGWQEVSVTQTSGIVKAVEIQVDSVYEGSKYADLCISDVQVFATSETADNPAFEKSKRKQLLAWRAARVAAAKLFAKRKVDLPMHTGYKVNVEDAQLGCNGCNMTDMIDAATKDPAFKDWKDALATAAAAAEDVNKLPRGQIAPRSKQYLPAVDGFVEADLEAIEQQWFDEEGIHLPLLDSVSALFADQLRVLDVKDTKTPDDFAAAEKCKGGDMTWVKRAPSAEHKGPDTVSAVLIGRCGMLEERGGEYKASATELLVYNTDGKLALVVANGMIDGYRWTDEDGKPMIAGGVSLLGQGKRITATTQN